MGTPMLLTGLAVHREQMGTEVYFDRHPRNPCPVRSLIFTVER